MKIGIASDHAGYDLKEKIKEELNNLEYEIIDYGTNNKNSVDYPKYALLLSKKILEKEVDYGIIICKTGIGMSITCNRIKGIRCAKVCTEKEAVLARKHNDANIIAISGMMSFLKAKKIILEFLNTQFSGEIRHKRRLKIIEEYNNEF